MERVYDAKSDQEHCVPPKKSCDKKLNEADIFTFERESKLNC